MRFLGRLALVLAVAFGAPLGASAQRLTPPLAAAINRAAAGPIDETVTLGDRTNYTRGSFVAYASDFRNPNQAPTNAAYPIGFNSITVNPARFASAGAARILWDWPSVGEGLCPNPSTGITGGPCGYLHVAFGCYDWSVAQTPITPRTVASLNNFRTTWSTSYDATAAEKFGGLHELYLWSTTTCGDSNANRKIEIGMFTHASTEARAFGIFNGFLVGTHTNEGVTYNVYNVADVYEMFIPQCPGNTSFCAGSGGDNTTGAFDWKAAIAYLQANTALINSAWYVRGVAMGVEPTQDSGWWELHRFDVTIN